MKKLLIVDFMYLWNRMYAIKGVLTGEHVGRLFKALNDSDYYDGKFIILDGTQSTKYRRKIYPEYKTNRSDKSKVYDGMQDFLTKNYSTFKKCKVMENDSYEADDVITMLVKAHETTADKYIYSGDTDLYQLLRFPHTYIGTKYSGPMVLDPISMEEALTRYEKKYNMPIPHPSYITKCKMFKGDPGDNVPIACPGLRSSTISKLIENCWREDAPLTSTILLNMAKYLKKNCTEKEFNNFYNNREALIRNYKLTQLGYTDQMVTEGLKVLNYEDGKIEWL